MSARRTFNTVLCVGIGLALTGVVIGAAHAAPAGPFGVGVPEAVPTGMGGIFTWLAARQAEFYLSLKDMLRLLRTDPAAAWPLIALSFAYGIVHAAGPGHGKAVISAYLVANGETLRRGVVLAFISAFVQAASAIILIFVATQVLNLTSFAITDASLALELASGAAITVLGLVLLTRPLRRAKPAIAAACPPPVETVATAPSRGLTYRGKQMSAPDLCATCGNAHVADPHTLAGRMTARRALGAVLAVGLRPCTGALIVLTFAFSLKVWWAGVLSALAMAVGTGLTVAVLATLAVTARDTAVRLAGADNPLGLRLLRGAEIAGALAILAVGVLILGAGIVGQATAGG